jgi:hypothetical protein
MEHKKGCAGEGNRSSGQRGTAKRVKPFRLKDNDIPCQGELLLPEGIGKSTIRTVPVRLMSPGAAAKAGMRNKRLKR